MTEEEIERILSADKYAKAICDHSFDQSVIDRCEPYFQARLQALINGTTTVEKRLSFVGTMETIEYSLIVFSLFSIYVRQSVLVSASICHSCASICHSWKLKALSSKAFH